MPRPKKDSTPISLRIDNMIFERLNTFCEASGQSKTTAIERALSAYIDAYEANQKALESARKDSIR